MSVKVISFYALALLFFSSKLLSSSIESVTEKRDFIEGEVIEARLSLSNFDGLLSDLELKGKSILNFIYVQKIKKVFYSKENQKDLIVEFTGIIERLPPASLNFKFNRIYKIENKGIKVAKLSKSAQKPGEFVVLDEKSNWWQELLNSKSILFILFALFLTLVFSLWKLLSFYQKKQLKKRNDNERRKFQNHVNSLKGRGHIENFYSSRKVWSDQYQFEKKTWNEFKKYLLKIQYKEKIEESELLTLQKKIQALKVKGGQ